MDWIDPHGRPRNRCTEAGGGLYTGVGGGLYGGPGGGLFSGPGGGIYSGAESRPPLKNWPPISLLLQHLNQIGYQHEAALIRKAYRM
ncbi:MAG: hypothetical protein WBO08_06240 [Mycobacterium sp.]